MGENVVVALDRRLLAGVTDEQVAALGEALGRLRLNLADRGTTGVPS